MSLHVDPSLLGSKIYNTRTHAQRKIIAVWMEEPEKAGYRPTFVALTVNMDERSSHHNLLKISLPDPNEEWELIT